MPSTTTLDGPAIARRNMFRQHGMTESDINPRAQAKTVARAAVPNTLAEAKGDSRAFSRADMRRQVAALVGATPSSAGQTSMAAELRRMGLEPAR